MRSINLLKVAAEAELLRLRAMLARQGRRAAFGVVAVIFMLGVLVLAEIAGWQVLRLYVASISATLILLGINFVIAAIFGALAARSSPSHTEREALRVRRQALDAARGTLSFAAAVPVASTLLRLGRRRGTASAIGVPPVQMRRGEIAARHVASPAADPTEGGDQSRAPGLSWPASWRSAEVIGRPDCLNNVDYGLDAAISKMVDRQQNDGANHGAYKTCASSARTAEGRPR